MERLPFDGSLGYQAIEAAIHLNRYAIVRGLVAGKRVLDAACGEGFGSFLMSKWGAREVTGIDISEAAIDRAREYFQSPGLDYVVQDAQRLSERFEAGSFDVIVSLETFEHLPEPSLALDAMKRLLAPGGVIVVSCPNDNWYYRTPEESNPFHARKYSFGEFKDTVRRHLGDECRFLLGTPASGFINVPESEGAIPTGESFVGVLSSPEFLQETAFVPPSEDVNQSNCSYFVAVFGESAIAGVRNAAIFPCSMDSHLLAHRYFDTANLSDEVVALRTRVFDLGTEIRERDAAIAELNEAVQRRKAEPARGQETSPEPTASVASAIALEKANRSATIRQLALSSENQTLIRYNVHWVNQALALQQQVTFHQSSASALEAERARLLDSIKRLEATIRDAETVIAGHAAEQEVLETELRLREDDIASMALRLSAMERACSEETAKVRYLTSRFRELKTPLGLLRAAGRALRSLVRPVGRASEAAS